MEALGPYVLTARLTPEGAVQERFRVRRVEGGDLSGPMVLTRRAGEPEAMAELLRSWCESAARRDAAAHAGVTRCLEVGAARGFVYEVSELADGETLAALLRAYAEQGDHPPLDVALSVARLLASLLAELHGRGIAVGYLVPERLIVTWDGRVVLDRIGVPDEGVRKAPWSAPELARQNAADTRTDAWVLGRVFRALLAGHGGSTARVPTKQAAPIKGLLQGLLTPARRKRLSLGEGKAQLAALLEAIDAEPDGALLSRVMAARFAARFRDVEAHLNPSALKRAAAEAPPSTRFYPPGAGSSPLPAPALDFERDQTESDHFRRAGSDTQTSLPAFSDSAPPKAESGSDEAGPFQLDVVSDPLKPTRTEVATVPAHLRERAERSLLVTDPKGGTAAGQEGSLPWAEAQSLEDDLDLHTDAQLPIDAAAAALDDVSSLPDFQPPPGGPAKGDPYDERASTLVNPSPVIADETRPDESPDEGDPSAATVPRGLKKPAPRQAAPDERTRTGTGRGLPFQEVPSVDNVWAESGKSPAAPAPEPEPAASDATELLSLPDARVMPSAVEPAPAGGSPDEEAVFAPAAELEGDEHDRLRTEETPNPTVAARPSAERRRGTASGGSGSGAAAGSESAEAEHDDGMLFIDAPAEATVYVDGERRGRGRIKVPRLSRYRIHHVRVHLAGHRPWAAEVSLDGEPAARVSPRLQRR